MIVKIVPKERTPGGEAFRHLFVEGSRIVISYHPDQPSDGEADWTFGDQVSSEEPSPVYMVRSWKAWPQSSYEVGYVRSGRIFLVNDAGKTTDKYVI